MVLDIIVCQKQQRFLKWTDEKSIHIHCVIHLNKVDENTRGHLETKLNNKAETVIPMTKSLDNSNISIVSPKSVRDSEFISFAFRINEDALPELVDNYSVKKQSIFLIIMNYQRLNT